MPVTTVASPLPSAQAGQEQSPETAKALSSKAPAEEPSAVHQQRTVPDSTAASNAAKLITAAGLGQQPRAAIYARVSTHNGQDPEMQLREVREYCARRGWQVSGEYVDRGISGSKERRPELDRLLADCRKRYVDAVVVYRYDRFARSLRQLVNALEEFRGLGIDFVSLHEGVDTSTPNGRLVFGIFATIAEFERELIRDRVRSGIASARAKGKRLGRPRADFDVSRAQKLRSEGRSWRQIAQQMDVPVATLHRTIGGLAVVYRNARQQGGGQ